MKNVEYLINTLYDNGVTDIFGIPGGVILDFIYAANASKKLNPHLCYHEQAAGFAAIGYAQVSGKLGVAYATRGPGFTNLITPIAEAFQESLPVLFITAHNNETIDSSLRMISEQELDTVSIVKSITKYAVRIDDSKEFCREVYKACKIAMNGRKGPVFLDIRSKIFDDNILNELIVEEYNDDKYCSLELLNIVEKIKKKIAKSKRPVILVGSGVQLSGTSEMIKNISEYSKIPILSSRGSQDLFNKFSNYYGYIGSHGLRYSNFILSKTDLIIVFGNRLSFPNKSRSFWPLIQNTELIWIDIDYRELSRFFPKCKTVNCDLKEILPPLYNSKLSYCNADNWINVCNEIYSILNNYDVDIPVEKIVEVLMSLEMDTVIVSDVGNNEFWLSRAYAYANIGNRLLYSRNFGSLGCSLPKAIGVYYYTKKPVACFVGDQGMQLNIQELQFVSDNNIPISIILLNNNSSGMIKSHEKQKYGNKFLHTTKQSGYSCPNWEKIARAYEINYQHMNEKNEVINIYKNYQKKPVIVEINISEDIDLDLYLKKGNVCQQMSPLLEEKLYNILDNM